MRSLSLVLLSTMLLTGCEKPRARPTPPPAADPADSGSVDPPGGHDGGGPAPPLMPPDRMEPNPIVSRGRPVRSSAGNSTVIDGIEQPLSTINDGDFENGDGFAARPAPGQPAWVA